MTMNNKDIIPLSVTAALPLKGRNNEDQQSFPGYIFSACNRSDNYAAVI